MSSAASDLLKRFLEPFKSKCECVTHRQKTRGTYCNIFCIINFHPHLPIKSSNLKKKEDKNREKEKRDESHRVSDWRSFVHEPRTVEVALLIIGIYKAYQRKKEKKTRHSGEENLIICSFA